jgi:uncharacterized protein (DUF342 family)
VTNREVDDPEIKELYHSLVKEFHDAEKEYQRLKDLVDEREAYRLIEEFKEAERNLAHHKHTLEWFNDKYGEDRM